MAKHKNPINRDNRRLTFDERLENAREDLQGANLIEIDQGVDISHQKICSRYQNYTELRKAVLDCQKIVANELGTEVLNDRLCKLDLVNIWKEGTTGNKKNSIKLFRSIIILTLDWGRPRVKWMQRAINFLSSNGNVNRLKEEFDQLDYSRQDYKHQVGDLYYKLLSEEYHIPGIGKSFVPKLLYFHFLANNPNHTNAQWMPVISDSVITNKTYQDWELRKRQKESELEKDFFTDKGALSTSILRTENCDKPGNEYPYIRFCNYFSRRAGEIRCKGLTMTPFLLELVIFKY